MTAAKVDGHRYQLQRYSDAHQKWSSAYLTIRSRAAVLRIVENLIQGLDGNTLHTNLARIAKQLVPYGKSVRTYR